MDDAMKMAREMAEKDLEQTTEALLNSHPVDRVRLEGRVDMEDGSRLELVSNRIAATKPSAVTYARLTSRGWELDDPDAALVWRVHPAGSGERPGLMSAETEE